MITYDLSILNQKGTPIFYSDTLALRPAFGIVGRIFIAIDSPYGIFRDTGTAWDQIAGSGGGITGTGTATQIAFFSAATTLASSANLFWDNTNSRLGINTITPSSSLNVLGNTISTNTLTGITGTSPSALTSSAFSNNFTFNSGITTSASVNTIGVLTDNSLNYSGANTINVTSYNATVLQRNNLTFGTASASITYTQATGIRALTNTQNQYIQNGANNGTISHYTNFQILGDQKTGAGITTFTNRYGILINDFNEFTAGNTYTNRWGIYQAGLNESNFFAGKVGIGSGYSPGTYQLDVNGTARVSNTITGRATLSNSDAFPSYAIELNGINTTDATTRILINCGTLNSTGIGFGARALQATISGNGVGTFMNMNGNASIGHCTSTTGNSLSIKGFAVSTNGQTGSGSIGYTWMNANTTVFYQSIFVDESLKLWNTTGDIYYVKDRNTTNITFGTSTFYASAQVAIESTTKGFLPPRMTTTEKNAIATPAQGLMLFDTTLVKLCVYSGTAWETVTSV